MKPLSNADLLDGDVARNFNSARPNPNRAERLQRTTQFAENPEQAMEEPAQEATHNFNYSEPSPEVEDEKPSSAQLDRYSSAYPEPKKEEKNDTEDKIFGMNKWLVIGVATAVVAIGGYFVYTKFFKKPAAGAGAAGGAAAETAAAATAATATAPTVAK